MDAPAVWIPAYVALGSNLDGPRGQIQNGFAQLARLDKTRLVARSSLYSSVPLGPQEQPDFVNAVAGLMTKLPARQLLSELKRLEQLIGREQPVMRWGPRRIDFDLLVYDNAQIAEPDLVIPHYGIPQRNFVLYPLCEIAPELVIPGLGRVRELMNCVSAAGLHVLAGDEGGVERQEI